MSKFVRVCEALAKQEFDLKNFKYSKKIKENGKKKQVYKTLEDIGKEYPNIDIIKIKEETGVESNYSVGGKIKMAKREIQGNGMSPITEEEKLKLKELGVVSLETKESAISELVRVWEALARQGLDFSEYRLVKNEFKI